MNNNKKISIAIKILPFAFALHNIEEAWSISSSRQIMQDYFTVNPVQFNIAVSLYTMLGLVIVFNKNLYPTIRSYQYVVTGFIGMLFLNSFFPHILSGIYLGSYTPGLVTASLLILPLTSYTLWQIFKSQLFSKKQLIVTILCGGVIGLILVFIFLWIGFFLTSK